MTYKTIYLLLLVLMTNNSLCFPNRKPRSNGNSCNFLFLTGCLSDFNPTFELKNPFFPVLQNANLKRKDVNIQFDRIFPQIFINTNKNDYASENEPRGSLLKLNTKASSPETASNYELNKETIASGKQNVLAFNSLITETNTDNTINSETITDYIEDNTITTNEDQEVTTENELWNRSHLSGPVLASLLG